MNFSGKIYFYFITLLICSAVITIAGIYGYQRLEPTINLLNSSNTQSIYYAEQMLVSISGQKDIKVFEENLKAAKDNITEAGEKEITDKIAASYIPAFNGDIKAEEETVDKITDLTEINRAAMVKAGIAAKKQRSIGIWIILFPSIFVWILGFAILKRFDRTFIKPVLELNDVIFDYNKGNRMRRCPSITVSKDLQMLYDGINNILDNK